MSSFPSPSILRTKFALRLQRRKTGTPAFTGESEDRTGNTIDANELSSDKAGVNMEQTEGMAYEITDAEPIADNEDVWKKNFAKSGRTRIKRLISRAGSLSHFITTLLFDKSLTLGERLTMVTTGHEWKPLDLEEHRAEKEDDRLLAFHKEQARLIKPLIIETLTRLGFCYSIVKNERRIIKGRVHISHVVVTQYAYTFFMSRIPFGVKTTDMAQDWVATELAVSLRRKVRVTLDQVDGLRYTVEIGSTLSIPNFVEFKDVEKIPQNQPPLAFWTGSTTNGNPVYRNLADAPHILIAGSTGGGKSNMLNVIIITLLMRQSADNVRMVFFDLKGGVEFGAFEDIPQLWHSPRVEAKTQEVTLDAKGKDKEPVILPDCDGIIEYPDQVLPALMALWNECNRRLLLMKKAKGIHKNIAEFNRGKHPRNRLPYIVVFFDEWATARKLVGERAETLVSNIANLARATGIHFVLATQNPKAEIINTLITVNFPWRIAFSMSNAASQSVLGNWDAFGLSPIGRAIFQTNGNDITIQTPRITNSTIMAVVEAVKHGGAISEMANVDAEEVLEWALENRGGKLDGDSLFAQFQGKLSKAALSDLLISMDDQVFDVHGTLYRIVPPAGVNARRMEIADGQAVTTIAESEKQGTGNNENAAIIPEPEDDLLGPCPFCSAPRKHNPCEFCGQAEEEE